MSLALVLPNNDYELKNIIMKRSMVRISGTIHMVLFIGWLIPMMFVFIAGPTYVSLWMIVVCLMCILSQLLWAIVESDWVNEIHDEDEQFKHELEMHIDQMGDRGY